MYPIEYFTVDNAGIVLNEGELRRRLCVSGSFDVSEFDTVLRKVGDSVQAKCCFTRVPVQVLSDCGVDLGFAKVRSANLAKNLSDCNEAFVFAVTLGHGVERLLSGLCRISPADFFIADAVSSAIAESVCDIAEERIKGGLLCKSRFSPGYGDFDISVQRSVLDVLNAEKLLGITLTDGVLMLPQKSITAVLGIVKNQ